MQPLWRKSMNYLRAKEPRAVDVEDDTYVKAGTAEASTIVTHPVRAGLPLPASALWGRVADTCLWTPAANLLARPADGHNEKGNQKKPKAAKTCPNNGPIMGPPALPPALSLCL